MRKRTKRALRLPIPTENDWADTSRDDGMAIDREWSRKIFGGRSREQAVELFFDGSSIERIEELRWMPPVPFRFYLLACLDYIQSDRLRTVREYIQRPDAASSFLRLIIDRESRWPGDLRPIFNEVLSVVDFVASHQEEFEADEEIYGSFQVLASKIHDLAEGRRGN